MKDRIRAVVLLIFFPCFAWSQGYSGLGIPAPGFAVPDRQTALEFPRDDGMHPDFRIEWWYLTANLQDASGNQYGVQWTLFRNGLEPAYEPGWENRQVWMAHAALTSVDAHYSEERFSRGGTGAAGVSVEPFDAWLDDWRMVADPDAQNQFALSVQSETFGYDLRLADDGARILQGEAGYSVKSQEGAASHYYSRPNFLVSGQIRVLDQSITVSGSAWLDREWSSQPLSTTQQGWDWFGVSLDDGRRIMVARVRDLSGDFLFGTFIETDGSSSSLSGEDIVLTPIGKAKAPTRWRVEIPARDVDLDVAALNPKAWTGNVFSYWEGPVVVSGSHMGRGYLEMTGYPD